MADNIMDALNQAYENETDICIINPDTRTIDVPSKWRFLGVTSDEKSKRVPFKCPRYVDDIDLMDYSLYINYENADGTKDAHHITDVTLDGDFITFTWLLSRQVTAYKGDVHYILCAKIVEDTEIINEWNTVPAVGTVSEGLEATSQIVDRDEDVIEQILMEIETKQDVIVFNTAYDATSNKAATIADVISIGDDVVFGYYNPTTNKFYEEGTYQTEITPDDDKIYVDEGNEYEIYRYWPGSAGKGYYKISPSIQTVSNWTSPINLWERKKGEFFYTTVVGENGIKYDSNNKVPISGIGYPGAFVMILDVDDGARGYVDWMVINTPSSSLAYEYRPQIFSGKSKKDGTSGNYEYWPNLPVVTASDEGKILKVQDGMWKAVSP